MSFILDKKLLANRILIDCPDLKFSLERLQLKTDRKGQNEFYMCSSQKSILFMSYLIQQGFSLHSYPGTSSQTSPSFHCFRNVPFPFCIQIISADETCNPINLLALTLGRIGILPEQKSHLQKVDRELVKKMPYDVSSSLKCLLCCEAFSPCYTPNVVSYWGFRRDKLSG